jgi:hypothetical protein
MEALYVLRDDGWLGVSMNSPWSGNNSGQGRGL